MMYFDIDIKNDIIEVTPDYYIKQRKNRDSLIFSLLIKKILVGDIFEFVYFFKNIPLTFSGICIAIKRKSFCVPDIVIILRNVIIKTGIEVTASYFYNRIYKLKFLDYKRKFYTFNKNKLYYVRKRVNRESKIL